MDSSKRLRLDVLQVPEGVLKTDILIDSKKHLRKHVSLELVA